MLGCVGPPVLGCVGPPEAVACFAALPESSLVSLMAVEGKRPCVSASVLCCEVWLCALGPA